MCLHLPCAASFVAACWQEEEICERIADGFSCYPAMYDRDALLPSGYGSAVTCMPNYIHLYKPQPGLFNRVELRCMSLKDIDRVFKNGKRAAESDGDAMLVDEEEGEGAEEDEGTHVPDGAIMLHRTPRYWAEWTLAIMGHDGEGDTDTPQAQLAKLLAADPAALALPARMREYLSTHGGSTRVFRLLGATKAAICESVRDIMLRETLGEWSCRGLVKETHTYLMATEDLNVGEAPGFGDTSKDHYRQHVVRTMLQQPYSMLLFCIPGHDGNGGRGISGDVTRGLRNSGVMNRFIKELEQSGETFPVLTVLQLDRFMAGEFTVPHAGAAAAARADALAEIRKNLNQNRIGPMNHTGRGLAFKTQVDGRVHGMVMSTADKARLKAVIKDNSPIFMHTLAVDVSERLFKDCAVGDDGYEFSLDGLLARLLRNKDAHAARLYRGAMRALVSDCMLPLFTTLTSQVGSFRAARMHGGLAGEASRLVHDLRAKLQAHVGAAALAAAAAPAAEEDDLLVHHAATLRRDVVDTMRATVTEDAILERFRRVEEYGRGKHTLRLDMLSQTPQDTPLRDVLLYEFVDMLLPFTIQLHGATVAVLQAPVDDVHAFLNGWAAHALAAVAADDPLRGCIQALKTSLVDAITQKVRRAAA
jgi:hypothetical protein